MENTAANIKIKTRVSAFVAQILDESDLNPAFKPTVKKLLTGYLDKMTDDQLRTILLTAKNEVLPWLLGES
jgi:hypothetical protein